MTIIIHKCSDCGAQRLGAHGGRDPTSQREFGRDIINVSLMRDKDHGTKELSEKEAEVIDLTLDDEDAPTRKKIVCYSKGPCRDLDTVLQQRHKLKSEDEKCGHVTSNTLSPEMVAEVNELVSGQQGATHSLQGSGVTVSCIVCPQSGVYDDGTHFKSFTMYLINDSNSSLTLVGSHDQVPSKSIECRKKLCDLMGIATESNRSVRVTVASFKNFNTCLLIPDGHPKREALIGYLDLERYGIEDDVLVSSLTLWGKGSFDPILFKVMFYNCGDILDMAKREKWFHPNKKKKREGDYSYQSGHEDHGGDEMEEGEIGLHQDTNSGANISGNNQYNHVLNAAKRLRFEDTGINQVTHPGDNAEICMDAHDGDLTSDHQHVPMDESPDEPSLNTMLDAKKVYGVLTGDEDSKIEDPVNEMQTPTCQSSESPSFGFMSPVMGTIPPKDPRIAARKKHLARKRELDVESNSGDPAHDGVSSSINAGNVTPERHDVAQAIAFTPPDDCKQEEITRLRAEIKKNEVIAEGLRNRLGETELELERRSSKYNQEVARLKESLKRAEGAVTLKEGEIKSLQTQLQRTRDENEKIKKKLSDEAQRLQKIMEAATK